MLTLVLAAAAALLPFSAATSLLPPPARASAVPNPRCACGSRVAANRDGRPVAPRLRPLPPPPLLLLPLALLQLQLPMLLPCVVPPERGAEMPTSLLAVGSGEVGGACATSRAFVAAASLRPRSCACMLPSAVDCRRIVARRFSASVSAAARRARSVSTACAACTALSRTMASSAAVAVAAASAIAARLAWCRSASPPLHEAAEDGVGGSGAPLEEADGATLGDAFTGGAAASAGGDDCSGFGLPCRLVPAPASGVRTCGLRLSLPRARLSLPSAR